VLIDEISDFGCLVGERPNEVSLGHHSRQHGPPRALMGNFSPSAGSAVLARGPPSRSAENRRCPPLSRNTDGTGDPLSHVSAGQRAIRSDVVVLPAAIR
jgi:hypothetical protein